MNSEPERKRRKSIPHKLDEKTTKILLGGSPSSPESPEHDISSCSVKRNVNQPLSPAESNTSAKISSRSYQEQNKSQKIKANSFQDFVPTVLPSRLRHKSQGFDDNKSLAKASKNKPIVPRNRKTREKNPSNNFKTLANKKKFIRKNSKKVSLDLPSNENQKQTVSTTHDPKIPSLKHIDEASIPKTFTLTRTTESYERQIFDDESEKFPVLNLPESRNLLLSVARQPFYFMEFTSFFVAHGCDVNQSDSSGWTALHEAIKYDNFELVIHLLELGADPNFQPSASTLDYITPFEFSCSLGNLSIIRSMLMYGADIAKKTPNGRFDILSFTNSLEVTTLILGKFPFGSRSLNRYETN